MRAKDIKSRAGLSNSMPLPTSVPGAPAAMLVDYCPNQDQANDEINNWLASGLQSYVEEGQRMRDAADGIPLAKPSVTQRSTTHVADRHDEVRRPLSLEPRARSPSEPRRDDDAVVLSRMHELLRTAQVQRRIMIKGEGNKIYLNSGSGQQNIYNSGSCADRNNNYDEGYGDGGYGDGGYGNNGYDDDYGDGGGEHQGNGQAYDQGYHQFEFSHDGGDGGDDDRPDYGYYGYTSAEDGSSPDGYSVQ